MTWTLLIVWWLGSNAGQNAVITRLPTLEACETLRAEMQRRSVSYSRCIETVR
jgi:hypothetical protein